MAFLRRHAGIEARMDPFAEMDAFANAMADAVVEAVVKASLIAGCVGLTIFCGAALLARRRRG